MTPCQLQVAMADNSLVIFLLHFGYLRSVQGLIVLLVAWSGLGRRSRGFGLV